MNTVSTTTPNHFEELLCQVRGVSAARVISSNDQISEIHVVALPGRSAKQIIRDIETILLVQGGVRIDYRKVSLVQLPDLHNATQAPRIQLGPINYSSASDPPIANVELRCGTTTVNGTAQRSHADQTDLELVGQATMNALNQLIGQQWHLSLDGLISQPFQHLTVCLAQVTLDNGASLETLLGISNLRHDPHQSAVRAVLDAVNRRLSMLLANVHLLQM
jgi:hypothetical protein